MRAGRYAYEAFPVSAGREGSSVASKRAKKEAAAPAPRKGLTYAGSGVDVEAEERGIKRLVKAIGFSRKGLGAPYDLPGGYAGLVDMGDHALVLCTDGVGSKVEIARAMRKFDTVGIDCIAMNVNDCICVGAEPIAFVDYLAISSYDDDFMEAIGRGLGEGARQANVSLIGGETATLPEIVKGFDLAGTCLGRVAKDRVVDGTKVRPGDVLIGLPSTGIHSNGHTLARRILQDAGIGYQNSLPDPALKPHAAGQVLLEPTRIYVEAVMALLRAGVPLHAMAHVTGGGLKNLPRMNRQVSFRIEDPLRPQPVFRVLAELGGVAEREMYQTFNMGMGFVLCVPSAAESAALRVLRGKALWPPAHVAANEGEAPRVVGRVAEGRDCLLVPSRLSFTSKT